MSHNSVFKFMLEFIIVSCGYDTAFTYSFQTCVLHSPSMKRALCPQLGSSLLPLLQPG